MITDEDNHAHPPSARRWVHAVAGVVLVAAGSTAALTGEFDSDASWLLALGLALIGFAGLIATVAGSVAGRPAVR